METDYEAYANIFKAFCDPKRLRILALLQGGEKCACVLQEQIDVGQSGLSYHLKILVASGIVTSRQEGKWTHYRISENGRAQALNLLQQLTAPDPKPAAADVLPGQGGRRQNEPDDQQCCP